MNLEKAKSLLLTYIKNDIPAHLLGSPGIGKSDLIREIGQELKLPVIDFRAVLRDPVDLRGLPSVVDGKAQWLPPNDLPNAERDGNEGILFLDELNAASPMVQAACFGLVLDRKVGEYTLPNGWKIIAAGNKQSDRAAAQRMPTALANRFAHIEVDADVDAFCNYAIEQGANPNIIAFLKFRPNLLHVMPADGDTSFPTPRSWMQVNKIANDANDMLYELASGLIGSGAASEFVGFVKTAGQLPSIEGIFKNPSEVTVPDEPSARYAVTVALSMRVETPDQFEAGMRYMQRLPDEFELMFCRDACRLNKNLTNTKTFSDWYERNGDLLLA